MKRIGLAAVLAALVLAFSGCDDDSSAEAKEYDRQLALDSGDYDKVLALTENCGNDLACQMDRAGAYVGKAGYSIATVIAAITAEEGEEEFYKTLGRKATASAPTYLEQAKSIYEAIILQTGAVGSVCNKTNFLYQAAGYYGQASCYNHGMTVMTNAAVLMSRLDADPASANPNDVATLLNDDLDSLINLYGAEGSVTTDEINQLKQDICTASGGTCNPDSLSGSDITAYINANK